MPRKSTPREPATETAARPAWLPDFRPGKGARYLQVVAAMEQAVADGGLSPGDRLPPQRQLAELLGVDLTTVTRALAEAKRRHLVEARGALGTFVAAPTVELAQMVDLSMNVPPPPEGLDFDDLLRRGMSQVLMRTDANLLMTYQLGGGSSPDKAAGALWLAPMLGEVAPARLVACPGAQAALAALILALTPPGGTIVTEPLCYPGLRLAAEQLGRAVASVAADDQGMRPDALEAACREHGARVAYLNPTSQNPNARTMPAQRRRDIARVAEQRGIAIIEDDPYWLLTPHAPPPLAHYSPAHVYYIATLSKCLSPGLRTAYLVTPPAADQDAVLAALRSFALMSTPLSTALATQWVHDGTALALLGDIRAECAARLALARGMLGSLGHPPSAGIHMWHLLPSYWTSRELTQAAHAEDLRVTASDAFHAGPNPPNAIRISLGGVKERARLALALKKLADLLARMPRQHREIVV